MRFKDLSGQRFGRLVAIKSMGKSSVHGSMTWLCQCDCGGNVVARADQIKSGNTKSCGCLSEESRHKPKKHGGSSTKLYKVWTSIKGRCLNKNSQGFRFYGERGISICPEWLSFDVFRDWALSNGYKKGLSIERIDNNKGYFPENCKWIKMTDQRDNQRSTRRVTLNGQTKTLKQWSKATGIKHTTLSTRIFERNWPIERALTEKPRRRIKL